MSYEVCIPYVIPEVLKVLYSIFLAYFEYFFLAALEILF
jgi:hypothetical protein